MEKNNIVREVIYSKLKEAGWANVLRTYVLSEEFLTLINVLEDRIKAGIRFTPTFKNAFNPFFKCNHSKLKVVIRCEITEPVEDDRKLVNKISLNSLIPKVYLKPLAVLIIESIIDITARSKVSSTDVLG
jgi:hypothetical protein